MAIRRETIEKYSHTYAILKYCIDFLTKTFFRTTSINYEKVPKDEVIIFALNHQNALMDALALLANAKTQIVFLARADIFKKNLVIKVLTLFKILPIYRIRDGKESLMNNDRIFQKTIDVLKNKNGLAILPEGTHGGFRRLRTLKKGISRIAFEAEESNNFKLNIKIVPVGLDWSNYVNFRSKLLVYFGEPIKVSDYYDEYKNNPPRAMNLLRERIAEELKKYMIHIESEEYYEMFNSIRYIYLPNMLTKMGLPTSKQPGQLFAQQNIVKKLDETLKTNPDKIKELNTKTLKYTALLKELNLRHWVFQKPIPTFKLVLQGLLMLIVSPIYIFGIITNYIPYKVPVLLTKKVEDPQFLSSFRFVAGILIFTFYYITLLIIGFFVFEPWWLKLTFPISLPFTGLFSFHYFIEAKKLFAGFRYKFKKWFKDKKMVEIKQLYSYIIHTMDSITQN